MSLWKVAKDFRHVERIISHFQQDITRGLEAKGAPVQAAAQHLVGISEATQFKARNIAQEIGELVAAKAQNKVEFGPHDPLEDVTVEIRGKVRSGEIDSPLRPNTIAGSIDQPLFDSGQLANSITWGTISGIDGVEIQIGVPDDSPAADYAPIQELGGITGSGALISGAIIPPRPFLVPALVESIPHIESLMMKWIEYNAALAANVSI